MKDLACDTEGSSLIMIRALHSRRLCTSAPPARSAACPCAAGLFVGGHASKHLSTRPHRQAREMASFIKVVPSSSESEAPAKSIKSTLAIHPPASTSSTAQPLPSSRPAAPASARGSSSSSVAGAAAGVKVAQEKVVIAGSSGQSVQVAIRVRPMVSRETEKSDLHCVTVTDGRQIEINSGGLSARDAQKSFAFDHVFDQGSAQQELFDKLAVPLVQNVINGDPATIFCYGQTGSGKTFTMQGADKTPGIVQRVAAMIEAELARAARDHDADSELQVFASYVELYMEQLRDLLVANPAADLEIKEDPMGGIYVKDLTQRRVQTAAEMIAVTTEGQQRRTVAATKMNAESSRSHSMLQLTLRHVGKGDASSSARLTLIDLAGSERAGDTGATGIVLQQATKINQSLSALGNVMSALCDGSKHIPFRDSKLTRLLQNSFQGRSKTLMIACLSPASSNASESISTLRFADRAKHIKTRALAVADPKQARIQDLEREVRRLRSVLRQCKCGLASQVNAPGGDAGGDALDLAGDDAASAVPAYCVCLGATCCESSSSCIVS